MIYWNLLYDKLDAHRPILGRCQRRLIFAIHLTAVALALAVFGNIHVQAQTTGQASATLRISGEHSVAHYPFSVLTPGKIVAEIGWTGKSEKLHAKLLGRRRPSLPDPVAPYVEVSGGSPLQLVYEVTAADVARGTHWRLDIEDPTTAGDATIKVNLTFPTDKELQAQFEKQKISLRSGDFG